MTGPRTNASSGGGGGALLSPAALAGDEHKTCFAGTHRVVSAAETLRRLQPLLPQLGITRVADVTWLDEIGIPVYQAVRPNAWTLSVTQGKGLTAELAQVSAIMEAAEGWHAEREGPGERVATVADMEAECDYRVDELALERRHHLNPATELEWTRAVRLDGGPDTYLPTPLVHLDGRVGEMWNPPLFERSSNGLASGNTPLEAALHGLYEVVERDALVYAGPPSGGQVLRPESVDGPGRELLDRLAAAEVDVHLEVLPSPTGLACFRAVIWSEMFPVRFGGTGCHLDRDVALCRALTEAAQSRVTTIAGTRDDAGSGGYRQAGAAPARGARPAGPPRPGEDGQRVFDEVDTVTHQDLTDDLRAVVDRVLAVTGRSPLLVDHTRAGVEIPVVRVVCPGLQFDRALA